MVADLMNGDTDRALVAALGLLDMTDSAQALAALKTALASDNEDVRVRVMKAFELRRDPRANDMLVDALSDQSERIRSAAVSALSQQDIDTLIDPLSAVLLGEDVPELSKQGAARVLKTKRNKQSIGLLIQALADNPDKVRAECAATLAALTSFEFGDDYQTWMDWWKSIEPLSREDLLVVVLQHREAQLAEAKEALKTVKAEAADIWISHLEKRNDRTSTLPLSEAIRAKYPQVRRYAAAELAKIDSEEAARTLADAIKDDSTEVRKEVVSSLGKIGERARFAVAAIAESLLGDPQPTVREAAAAALNAIKDKDSTSALIAALRQDNSPGVRANAAKALGNIAADGAVSVLLTALYKDPEPSVRREAASALGNTKDRTTVPLLAERKNDQDHLVRRAIAKSLGQLGGQEAVSALLDIAKDSDSNVRVAAFDALGLIRDPAALSALIEGMMDPEETVARAAANALEKVLADDLSAYMKVADEHAQSGNKALSARLYEIILRHFAGKTAEQQALRDVKRRLAAIYLEQQKYKEALPLWQEISQQEPTLEALGALARCYEALGNHLDAAKTHLAIVQMEKSDTIPQWERIVENALALKSSGNVDQLRDLLELLDQKAPGLGTPETKAKLQALRQELMPPTPSPTPTPSTTPSPPPATTTPAPTPAAP